MTRVIVYKCSKCGLRYTQAVNTDKPVIEMPNYICTKDGYLMSAMDIDDTDIIELEKSKEKPA